MKKIPLVFLILSSFLVKAQDDLLSFLEVDTEPMYISSTFKGKKVVNGQSVEILSKGVLQFQIQHRFVQQAFAQYLIELDILSALESHH